LTCKRRLKKTKEKGGRREKDRGGVKGVHCFVLIWGQRESVLMGISKRKKAGINEERKKREKTDGE